MKTLILLSFFLLVGTVAVNAQLQKIYNISELTWLGIDFSHARFVGITESPETIIGQSLADINKVIVTEKSKYDIAKFFDKTIVHYNTGMADALNSSIDPEELVTNNAYDFEIKKVEEIVKKYNTPKNEGLGLVFIAISLDKAQKSGSYYVTFFDMGTKEVVYTSRVKGVSGGFGFRNYWAATAFNVMKQWKKENKK